MRSYDIVFRLPGETAPLHATFYSGSSNVGDVRARAEAELRSRGFTNAVIVSVVEERLPPMKRYRVVYRDPDPGAPNFSTIVKGYSAEHVEEKFIKSNDGDDWRIVSITQVDDEGRPVRRRRR